MAQHKTDMIILGAGVVGLVMALLAARDGFSVAIVDKNGSPQSIVYQPLQARTVALNETSMALLDDLHVWPYLLRTRLGVMQGMRVYDLSDMPLYFKSPNQAALATVIEHDHLQWALYQACLQHDRIAVYFNQTAESMRDHKQGVTLKLASQVYLDASLIIGADGANSWLCQHVSIPVDKRPYHHYACVGLASSEKGHQDEALQFFSKQTIVGVLPLNDNHQHSVIYSCTEAERNKLMAADAMMQDCILTNATKHQLGMCHWETPIKIIPLIAQHLQTYVKEHIAIIGDAAHRIHPLAGQGANLGFADAVALSQSLKKAKKNKHAIGSLRVLNDYHHERYHQNQSMLIIHDMLKEIFSDDQALFVQLRSWGLNALNHLPWVKQQLMRSAN